MFRIAHQFILTALFALFASQASAMFIQADWFDPSDPDVGTNRYSYSHNDPINLADPGGNVPYNPGGTTSTGWNDPDPNDGIETYDSTTDRGSQDYLNSDEDNHHTIGVFSKDFYADEDGLKSRTRSRVNTNAYYNDTGYQRSEIDAVVFDGKKTGQRMAVGAVAVASMAAGAGEVAAVGRAALAARQFAKNLPNGLRYADKVRKRALTDPKAHNYPYSYDKSIASTRPTSVSPTGYTKVSKPGYLNGKLGKFELGIRPDGIIDHRGFQGYK
ncbi:MAG: hypothetical protein ABJN52_04125 [Litorimonas sp.]